MRPFSHLFLESEKFLFYSVWWQSSSKRALEDDYRYGDLPRFTFSSIFFIWYHSLYKFSWALQAIYNRV